MKYNIKEKETSIYDFWIDQLIAGTIDLIKYIRMYSQFSQHIWGYQGGSV